MADRGEAEETYGVGRVRIATCGFGLRGTGDSRDRPSLGAPSEPETGEAGEIRGSSQ